MGRLNRFYRQMIFLLFSIFFLSCQNPPLLVKNQSEALLASQYLSQQGLFWIRQETCDCLNDDRSLDFEILFLEELTEINQKDQVHLKDQMKEIWQNKEKKYQKPWYRWGHWERVHLHEQLMGDVEKMQRLNAMLQTQPLGVLVTGEISSDLYEQAKHAFRTLQTIEIP